MIENPRPKDLALAAGIIGTSFLPIFRSGGRTGLTFGAWVVNHTVFGPPVEYVPEEDYARELEGVKIMQAYNQPVALALAEITDIWFWDPSIGHYNPSLTKMPTILIGTEAGAQFIVTNLSDESLDLGILITAYDPLGNPLGASISGPIPVAPGGTFGHHYRVTTERPGIYIFTTDIITSPTLPYGKIGPTLSWPVANVVGELPPLAGHVYDPFVLDDTTGETFYSLSLPVEIDLGHEVIVGIHWINDGDQTATFTPTFELIDPDGRAREIQTFDTVLSPSEHTGGQTGDSVKLDKAGMWKIHAILEAEGTLVDEKTWDAISVTAIAPPDYRNFEIISYSPTELYYGDKLTVACRVEHIGEAQSGKLRVAIGSVRPYWPYDFDEILHREVPVSFLESQDWEWKNITASINITEAIAPGTYELYAKLFGITGPDLYDYTPDDVFTVVKEVIPPECAIDADCPEGYACVAGKCVRIPPECTIDADCPEGYLCVAGKCVPKEEVEKKFPWAPVAIGAGALVAVIGVATAAKKEAK